MPNRTDISDEPLVSASGVEFAFGGKRVLERVDLAVHGGEIVTLIGPNGAGKTTLVRVVLGQLKPDRGSIRRKPGLTVGYLPQRISVDPTLPLPVRSFLNLPKRQSDESIRTVLDEVGADYTLDQAVQSLSGGELQRVLLARALLRDPQLLVLDEPLQSIDFTGQLALFQLIADVRDRRGCGVLMVSHDLHLVMAGTEQVVCLNRHVCCSGEPESVTRHPEYLALFGPNAAKGLAIYTHAHDHSHDLAGGVVSREHPDGTEADGGAANDDHGSAR